MDNPRKPNYKISETILKRWSPRSFTGEKIPDEELMSLFEAARWAPSSFNGQLWRFIYAHRETEHWDLLFNTLVRFNQSWAKDASALALIISRKHFERSEKPAPTHLFDAGAAWENLALEAVSRNLATHAMEGFDHEKARKDLEIPEEYDVIAIIAIGRQGPKEKLDEGVQKREFPSDRRPLSEIVMEGRFKQ